MGIRLLSGRDFTAANNSTAPGVVIVSESVARRAWPNESAVGKRISMHDAPGPNDWLTVVGVVNDVVQDEKLSRHSTLYRPCLQHASLFFIESHDVCREIRRSEPANVLTKSLFGVKPTDPTTLGTVTTTIVLVALLAGLLPVKAHDRSQPLTVLQRD